MPTYKTQTRKMLLDYLQSHADETLSASIISQALAALEKEGLLAAVREAGGRERYYRFTAAEQCRRHLHLSCKKCGRTFHLGEAQTEALVESIAALDNFAVDRSSTVLYGICENCRCTRDK